MDKKLKPTKTKKIGKGKKALAVGAITVGLLAGAVLNPFDTHSDLPDAQKIAENIEKFGADDAYLQNWYGFENTPIARIDADTSRPIVFCLNEQFTEQQYKEIHEIIDDLNIIFEHINPNYKFELSKTTPAKAYLDKNYIPITKINSTGKVWYSKNKTPAVGFILSHPIFHLNGTMSLKNSHIYFKNSADSLGLAAHEAGHLLGLADAYTIDDYSIPSVMNNYSGTHGYYMENDLYLLASLYGNFKTDKDYEKFKTFAKEFCAERDREGHLAYAFNELEINRNYLKLPPHVSYASCEGLEAEKIEELIAKEKERYNNGQVSKEEINQAILEDELFVHNVLLKQFNENCNKWSIESAEQEK